VNNDIVHVANRINPAHDIEIINTELILADIQSLEIRIAKLQKEAKANSSIREILDYLQFLKTKLDEGILLSQLPDIKQELIKDLHLLTIKPVIYTFNIDEETLVNEEKKLELTQLVAPSKAIFVCAKLEEELKGLNESDAQELLESYGVKETGLVQMIQSAYDTLGLQSYLTAGPKEVRAWTIKKGYTAPQAAGVIHTDFERGFIAAQVVDYNDLMEAGSEAAARAAGKIRTEGKEYIMQPDDVVEFRFNVSK
jgi:GTP-binding protein YchF